MLEAGLREPSLVAVVDDDRQVRQSVERLVASLGYAVQGFASAAEYLRSGRLSQIACLIADMQMPGMTGLELHAELRARGYDTPTILVTAYPSDDVRAEALAKGVKGYLVKPFREGELIEYLRTIVGGAATGGSA